MKAWEEQPRLAEAEKETIRKNLHSFSHTTAREQLRIAGVDGSGDFPALSYADSFVYVTTAQATVYDADRVSGLREVGPAPEPIVHFTWLPESETVRNEAFDNAFAYLAGIPLREVVEESDYRKIKLAEARRSSTVASLIEGMIRPHAADASNIGLQLRSTAELGAAFRTLREQERLSYLLMDGTLSLPLIGHAYSSLFYEHLKRLCCVEARTQGTGFLTLSKSHGLPSIELIEELAREKMGLDRGQAADHWYLRVPVPEWDGWELSLAQGRRLPPPGAVTYLVRFHRTTPVMRLDLDVEFWREQVQGQSEGETRPREQRLFEDLDYAGHDQRCYGYPYPIKAAHDRVSLTEGERVTLRKQIIDAALRAGLKRSLFRDAAQATGHR